ncbi:MAG TPA: YbhB/YbcL family Raf kinase inhibitor-like protein [Propionibacteriaceae bacterium]|nr:YbhB/YbcL family Raf kinase inhibitor-like protein [Propionibacteriaceae bacterium]
MNPIMPIAHVLLTPVGLALRGRRPGLEHSIATRPELTTLAMSTISLTSTSFRPDGQLGLRHAGRWYGDNVSPQLAWTRPPVRTKALLLVVEDVDSPTKDPIIHLAALLDAQLRTVSEGELNRQKTAPGVTLLDPRGYRGPAALPGHGEHRYVFHLFALDTWPEGDTLAKVIGSSASHVIAHGQLTGTFRA